MVRPRPAPASSARRANSVKISSRRLGLTPEPWSVTETSMVSGAVSLALRVIGLSFPSAWYQPITVGVFAKALGFLDLWRNIAAITIIGLAFLVLSLILLRKQEP